MPFGIGTIGTLLVVEHSSLENLPKEVSYAPSHTVVDPTTALLSYYTALDSFSAGFASDLGHEPRPCQTFLGA